MVVKGYGAEVACAVRASISSLQCCVQQQQKRAERAEYFQSAEAADGGACSSSSLRSRTMRR